MKEYNFLKYNQVGYAYSIRGLAYKALLLLVTLFIVQNLRSYTVIES